MHDTLLLDPVRILRGPGTSLQQGAVLIEAGVLSGFDDDARQRATVLGSAPQLPHNSSLHPAWSIHIPC